MDDFFNQSHTIHCNEEESPKNMIVFSHESNIPSSSSLQSNLNSKTSSFSAGHDLCFDNPNSEAHQNHSSKSTTQSQNAIPRANRQHHILAERKRREELTKNIVELSAIIPGLKKRDKGSVVREAVDYVKRLKERVKELENQKRENTNSRSLTKKPTSVEEELPEMKISVSDREVLIGIFCHNPNNTLVKVLSLLDNLHLSTRCSSVLPFGTSTFKVTIIAKMNDEYSMTIDDLIKEVGGRLLSLKSQKVVK
ncbi:Transcription factor bHLH25 Basic helix-loop-helix protein [Vigna angularis]|uniref:Transcription factor bHLH25 Basic helix-loop-helix protein n=1 Tax=Phaseolus angularis TaxID=3914 RepID=A0A8T0KY85_PHAAN|nr:Transcription factor bHLH25 Basic helix-loop-helix protein [Vigna angularis]